MQQRRGRNRLSLKGDDPGAVLLYSVWRRDWYTYDDASGGGAGRSFAGSRSSRELAMAIQARVPEGTVVYSVANYPQSLPFYLQQTIILVEKKGQNEDGY